jgi:hypothetical protein
MFIREQFESKRAMDRRRLPPHARTALDTLRRAVAATDDDEHNGVSNQEARTVLEDEEGLSTAGVNDVFELLQNRGEIYYVDEEVRIIEMTPPMPTLRMTAPSDRKRRYIRMMFSQSSV